MNYIRRPSYLRRPSYKLFKLHGSLNWGNPIHGGGHLDAHQSPEDLRNAIIELSDSLRYEHDQFVVFDEPQVAVNDWIYFPAISIPVQTKSHFSCPEDWLPHLDNVLEGVT